MARFFPGALLTVALSLGLTTHAFALGAPDLTAAPARDAEPVVLTGAQFGDWAMPANQTARLPLIDLRCNTKDEGCAHSHYAPPHADTADLIGRHGRPVDRILGYRWEPSAQSYVQIPFQVDERFTRYLANGASGFALYSGEDQHTTYAYPREGFRYSADGPAENPCQARASSPAATDPVVGLDTNDELVFMAGDAGPRAPLHATKPWGIEAIKEIAVTDPTTQNPAGYVYVMLAKSWGPGPKFNAGNGYVRYERDADADRFAYSQSSYGDYGAAAKGVHCGADGQVVRNADGTPKIAQRRPLDTAWITTPRYRFRYDGRWLMTRVEISPDGGKTYGPDLVDRWKARAFAQDPGSETPCCGYEEEDTNWGGSSILLGEKAGPVRTIRETWGADSGTNVIRRETFYRDAMHQKSWLRVHVIPPLDGIYAQWDFNAGQVERFYNSSNPGGVAIDGSNDEAFGNFDDPCVERYDGNDTSATDQQYRSIYRTVQACNFPYHFSVDPGDATFADANAALGWSQVSGPAGTIVDRITTTPGEMPAGGSAQSLTAVPYYRDDSCFDDGTGTNPGPKLKLRSADEPATFAGQPRKCWTPADGTPADDARFYQGSIATHGVHLLFLVDSDNARQTVPLTEIISDWQMIMLPGNPGNVGERYGRSLERPLVTAVAPR